MKFKFLAIAALAAFTVGAQAAPTVIEIVGSTAGRTAVHNNIVALLGGCTYAYDGTSSASKATRAIYHGTYNSKEYLIRTWWSGSVNGITPVVNSTSSVEFYPTTQTGLVASPGANITSFTKEAGVGDIGFSDVFAATAYTTPATNELSVGVITFKWFANEGTTRIDNITPLQVRVLYAGSEAPKSMFTGSSGDSLATVYPIGRNSSSGTRLTAMSESGYGTAVTNTVDQYTATESAGVVTGLVAVGNDGFDSGSSLKAVMNATYSGGSLIGYLGSSDFATLGGIALKWNGVDYSATAIQSGQYTFWGYLHMNSMTLAGDELDFYNGLRDAIIATPLDAGVLPVGTMNVQRFSDGGVIEPL